MEISHFQNSRQITKEFLFELIELAEKIRADPKKYSTILNGKIMITLFYEPSTRTRLSFESAIVKLGGSVIGTENAKEFSSVSKGESIEDTMRVLSKYGDIIVIRHSEEGSIKRASSVSTVPLINAGEGKGEHPTQALLDAYTIWRELGRLDNLKIAAVGDLASGRTIKSLCYLLGKFDKNEITFVSPENLKITEEIREYLVQNNVSFREEDYLEPVLPLVDIVYMTRIQKERISQEEYEMAKGKFVIDEKNISLLSSNSILMHPLPHVEEISIPPSIEESDKRVAYFRQAENGLWIRMALLIKILGNENR